MKDEVIGEGVLDQIVIERLVRPNGTRRVRYNFEYCTSKTEQHTGHLTNLNYLVKKYKPDELAAYMAARNSRRQEITGHDFSKEPSLQDAKNFVVVSRKLFDGLPDEVKAKFKNHVDFLKFVDNPANANKLIKMGVLKAEEVKDLHATESTEKKTTTPTTTQEEEKAKE